MIKDLTEGEKQDFADSDQKFEAFYNAEMKKRTERLFNESPVCGFCHKAVETLDEASNWTYTDGRAVLMHKTGACLQMALRQAVDAFFVPKRRSA